MTQPRFLELHYSAATRVPTLKRVFTGNISSRAIRKRDVGVSTLFAAENSSFESVQGGGGIFCHIHGTCRLQVEDATCRIRLTQQKARRMSLGKTPRLRVSCAPCCFFVSPLRCFPRVNKTTRDGVSTGLPRVDRAGSTPRRLASFPRHGKAASPYPW